MFLVLAAVVSYLMITSYIPQTSTLDKKMAQKKQLEQQMTQLKKQQDPLAGPFRELCRRYGRAGPRVGTATARGARR